MLSKLLEANNAPPSVTVPSNNVKVPTPQAAAKSVPAKGTLNEPIKTAPSKSEQIKPVTLQTSVPPLKTNTPKSVTKKKEAEVKQTDSKVSPSLAADVKSEVKPSPETKVTPTPKIAPLNEPINSKSSKRKLSETKSEEKKELAKTELVEKELFKKEPIKKEPVKKEPVKKEPVKKEPIKEEPQEEAPPISKTEEVKPEAEAETNVKTQEVVKKGRTPSKTEPLTIEVNESAKKKNDTVSVDSTPEEPPPKKRVVEQIAVSDHLELPLATSPKNKKKKGRAGRGRKKTLSGSLKVDIVSEEDLERSEEAEPDVSADLKDSELDTTDDSIDRKVKTPLTPSIPSPASPALSTGSNCDPETAQQQRAWRKSIMLVWKAAASHKYANVFLHSVTDEEAPGYSSIIFRPMDLSLIKKNIETGVIHTTTEFQRDIMLMFQNALMYNRKEHDVYRMAQEMRDDVMEQIQSFISTQLMVQTTERDSKFLRGKIDAPGHTRQSSKSGFTFLSL
ncbi:bromodomain-containing protein 8-like [Hydractinia symbiolongicarpus]|uniref:bromodomain-containing protein 8-like n=1 Tax=Hydractinia symbiolongicarpus TaxID=13093 RepID=UPI00254A7E2F|nr:bromodomain-containing protein 8-like [Hydractinia symbiolongicarpus]